jgi:hypothetical protein
MHNRTMIGILVASAALIVVAREVRAQDDQIRKLEQRVKALEQRVSDADSRVDTVLSYLLPPLPLLGIGLFCGLWARSSGRDFWLWFVAGALFNIFTLFAVLVKHEEDKAVRRAAEKTATEAVDL